MNEMLVYMFPWEHNTRWFLGKKEGAGRLLPIMLFLVALIVLLPGSVYATDGYSGGKLTDLFSTDAFTGNWEVFTKMNFIGKIMSWSISVFSLIGVFTVALRVMLTMLYLSGKNFWDNIDEIKSAGKNQSMFGMKALFDNAYNAKYGTGLDAIISFFLSMFPNVKAYSDYASDAKHANNLSEHDTVTAFLLKTALPNILIIFAFSMGFNGTLWAAYGTVVEAMGVAAENFVDTNMSALVDRAINTGSNYQFAYNSDGTKYGDFKQTVTKKVYTSLLKNSVDLTSEIKQSIGKAIDEKIATPIDAMSAVAALQYTDANQNKLVKIGDTEYTVNKIKYTWKDGAFKISGVKKGEGSASFTISDSKNGSSVNIANQAGNMTDNQARNLSYSVVVNRTKNYDNALSVPATEFGFSDEYYVHIFISKKANSDEHNYLTIQSEDSGNGSVSDEE